MRWSLPLTLLGVLAAAPAAAAPFQPLEVLGVDVRGNQLIYDPNANVTWYDARVEAFDWWSARAWSTSLSVATGGTTITDWALPTALNDQGAFCTQGPACSPFATLHASLGNVAFGSSGPVPLPTDGPFKHLLPAWFENPPDPDVVWPLATFWLREERNADLAYMFNFATGLAGVNRKPEDDVRYAIAVHSGRVQVPEPSGLLFLGAGWLVLKRLQLRNKLSRPTRVRVEDPAP